MNISRIAWNRSAFGASVGCGTKIVAAHEAKTIPRPTAISGHALDPPHGSNREDYAQRPISHFDPPLYFHNLSRHRVRAPVVIASRQPSRGPWSRLSSFQITIIRKEPAMRVSCNLACVCDSVGGPMSPHAIPNPLRSRGEFRGECRRTKSMTIQDGSSIPTSRSSPHKPVTTCAAIPLNIHRRELFIAGIVPRFSGST